MPFAENIGDKLPSRQSDFGIVVTSALLGAVVTFAEPGIDSLQMVGRYIEYPPRLLQFWLDQNPTALLCVIAAGVGMAAAVGTLRIRRGWRFICILVITVPISIMITYCSASSEIHTLVPLAWDSGAITTGPATVPIVLALSSGLSHSSGAEGSNGFGVVTLASLFPILSVLMGGILVLLSGIVDMQKPSNHDGKASAKDDSPGHVIFSQMALAAHSILPLVIFLVGVQFLILREKMKDTLGFVRGVIVTYFGLAIFNVGLYYGSLALGDKAGNNLPRAFKDYPHPEGMVLIISFGCVCGLIATFIDLEPCGLGELAHEVTNGKIRKMPLFTSISLGVGIGVGVGLARVIRSWTLEYILIPGYLVAIILSLLNKDETLVCIAWDAAGVTTGPVTVPLVLSIGVGLADITGGDGFGILACASVFPICCVLILGLIKLPPAGYQETLLSSTIRSLAASFSEVVPK
jgi:hypothetical protein